MVRLNGGDDQKGRLFIEGACEIPHTPAMLSRRVRPFVAAATLLLPGLAAGCGDLDKEPSQARDASAALDAGTGRPDGPGPVPDAGSMLLDVHPVLMDGATGIDTMPADTQGADAPSSAIDSGTGMDSAPAAVDVGGRDGALAVDLLPPPSTIVVLPDTQYYSAAYPWVFEQQTDWIRAQYAALNVTAVLHVGDIVEDPYSTEQWNAAATAMRVFDNLIPYLLVSGNHDTDAERQGLMDSTFAPASMPWIAGTMAPGHIDNSYTFVNLGGRPWLALGLEFGPRDAVVAWADSILKSYPTTPAMLVTHAYLYRDGTRYNLAMAGDDETKPSYQYFFPADSRFTPDQGINDGEMLWQKLVLPNPNVRLVFCGHDTGWARLTSTRPDGSVVHQMLSDYQWLNEEYFGYGYLRVLRFDFGRKTIQVVTYSPYLQKYLTDEDNQFTLPLYP